METDQIQKALFIKSDAQTKANVVKVVQPVHNWRRDHGTVDVSLALAQGRVLSRDGVLVKTKDHKTVQDVYNELSYAKVVIGLGSVMDAVQEAMVAHATPGDRAEFVKNFIAEVENLRATADELADRISDVEQNQQS